MQLFKFNLRPQYLDQFMWGSKGLKKRKIIKYCPILQFLVCRLIKKSNNK